MKKEIILSFVVLFVLYKLFTFYKWIKKERKKYKNRTLPYIKPDLEELDNDECRKYPIDTSPNSPYQGVYDTTTLTVCKVSFTILSIFILMYLYFN
jgi:hypothetical protein